MRERNHKCENCGRIYVTLGSKIVRRNWCSATCRDVMTRYAEREYARACYHSDPAYRERVAMATKRWQVYRRSEESIQREREYRRQWEKRRRASAQILSVLERITTVRKGE